VPIKKSRRALRPFELFDDFGEMARMWHNWPFLRRSVARLTQWSPSVDMFEHGNRLVIKTDLPAMKREEIDVRLEDGDLVISGERHETEEVKEDDYYRMERASGSFHRRIDLPFAVEAKDVQAKFENGVLEIDMPKPTQTRPAGQQIKIR
jgi:HSP20 family protein